MHSHRKTATVGAVLLAVVLLAGWSCSQSQYDRAARLSKDFAASVLVAQQVEIQAAHSGFIDANTHKLIQTELVQIADAGVELDAAINQAHSASGAAAQVKIIVQLLGDLTGKLGGIKNEQAKLALQSALLVAQTTIDSIAAFGGGTK